jgi:hypothetical protein
MALKSASTRINFALATVQAVKKTAREVIEADVSMLGESHSPHDLSALT